MPSPTKLWIDDLSMRFQTPCRRFPCARPCQRGGAAGLVRQPDRPVRLRQEHHLQHRRRAAGAEPGPGRDRRHRRHRHHRPGRLHAAEGPAAAVADADRQHHPRHGDPGRAAARGARAGAAAAARYGLAGFEHAYPQYAVGRHAPARRAAAHPVVRHRRDPARRAVRRARCADQAAHAGVAAGAVERLRQDRGVRHPRCRGGDLPVRRGSRDGNTAGPHHRHHPGRAGRGRACAPAPPRRISSRSRNAASTCCTSQPSLLVDAA